MNIKLTEAEKIKILNSDDVYGVMQKILLREEKIDQNREHFWVIGLENNNRILFIELISLGTVNASLVEPMEVFSLALQKRAVKIMLCHNHPSGDLQPSIADKDVTDRLIQVGLIVKTPVIDHLIISTRSYVSFNTIGILDTLKESTKYVPTYQIIEKIKKESDQLIKDAAKKAKETLKEKVKAAKVKIAKELKSAGMGIEAIAKLTELPVEDVEKIRVRKG
jgi:DNA repair protein RadC